MLALINSQAQFPLKVSVLDYEAAMQRFVNALEDVESDRKEQIRAILADENISRLIEGIFGTSPYLSKLMQRNVEFVAELFSKDPATLLASLIAEVGTAEIDDLEKIKKHLRVMKGKVALCAAVADLAGVWNLGSVTSALSSFADSAVKAAVNFLIRKAAREELMQIQSRYDPAGSSGLIVLGMGKLGALELNYSSDIDLIIFFDGLRANAAGIEDPQKFYIKLARELVSILSDRTEDGYVFRTDLRLRPDPSSTPVAVSTMGALTYYETVGQNWERAAMIKARQIAGDRVAGDEMMKNLVPYVWRKNLDFAAIRDIQSIKRQMDERLDTTQGSLNGFNVKLGAGGIREIEFFVQTQQLIWGGKQPQLRVRATCDALAQLALLGHISEETRDALTANYTALRTIEHRLQMINDEQTHSLPETAEGMQQVAAFAGYAESAAFEENLRSIIFETHGKYTQIFKEEKNLAEGGNLIFTGVENDSSTLETIKRMGFKDPEYICSSIRAWHHGSRRSTRTKKAREAITELTPHMLKTFSKLADPDAAFRTFDDLIAGLPAVSQIFTLFSSNTHLLELIVQILGNSPYLTEILRRKPERIDAILYPRFFAGVPDAAQMREEVAELVQVADGYEEKMDAVRRYAHEKQLQAGVHFMKGLIDAEGVRLFLSDIADEVLATFTELVSAQFRDVYGSFDDGFFAVIGFGKLGGRELGIASDLDVVFVYSGGDESKSTGGTKNFQPNVYYMRLAQRIMGAISGLSPEGRLYEVDVRLRPHGSKGAIASSMEAFSQYYQSEAWPVELLALSRARIICCQGSGKEELERVLESILKSAAGKPEMKPQVIDVRGKISLQHPVKSALEVKYAKGGLMDAEFIVQYKVLEAGASDFPAGTIAQALWLMKKGLLDEAEGSTLVDAMKLFRKAQLALQLAGGGETANPALLSIMEVSSIKELEEKLNICMERTYNLYQKTFS